VTTATKPLATIDGVMLTPGVSKNNRLYTRDAIGRAVARMRERLQDPTGLPIVMRTHHEAGDNSRLIVGRITDVTQQPDGSAAYKAHLYNTDAGRDIGTLIDPKAPALKSTSVHGYWIGPIERHRQGADTIETADDLEVDAIDFTASPGVTGAQIRSVAFESVSKSAADGAAITETADATVTLDADVLTEVADEPNPIFEKYSAAQRKSMAAKGQAMTNGSYPIANKGDVRKAIRAVGRGGADHDAIRKHIIARAKALGFASMIPDTWANDGSMKETAPTVPAEPDMTPIDEAYVLVCVGDDSGPLVSVRSSNVDPGDVKKAAKQAAKIAARAIKNAPDEPAPAEPDDGTYDTAYSGETHTPEGTVAQTWTVSVNGKEMDADEAKAIVAAAVAETAPKTPAPAVEPAPTPAAAPAVVEQKEVAVSDTAKVVEQATPVPAPVAPAATDLPALIAAAVNVAVTSAVAEALPKAVKKALKERKPDKASQGVQQAAAPAVIPPAAAPATETAPVTPTATAESTTKAGTTQVTEAAPAEAGITAAQLKEALEAERTKTIAEVRTQLLNENGVPGRKGYRVNESDGKSEATGDDLWDRRSEVWSQVFPSQMSPAPAPAVAATAA
jgi:hypothetical protein